MKNLKAAREYCGFTQEQLAEMIDVSRVTLARYEAGNLFPDEKRLIRLADCLGVSIDYLLGRVPMDVEIKKETPPELPEGVQEIRAVVSAAADQPQLDAALEAAVRRSYTVRIANRKYHHSVPFFHICSDHVVHIGAILSIL